MCFLDKKTTDKTFQLQETNSQKHNETLIRAKSRIEQQPLKQHYTKNTRIERNNVFAHWQKKTHWQKPEQQNQPNQLKQTRKTKQMTESKKTKKTNKKRKV